MNISFHVNGENITLDIPPEKRLIDILREDLGLIETKSRCYAGECGFCAVLFNGEVQLSCLIPAFAIRNSYVLTIEGFSETEEYRDIERAFEQVGYDPCDYCRPSKILAIHSLLIKESNPGEPEINELLNDNLCRCSDLSSFVKTIPLAAYFRGERRHGR